MEAPGALVNGYIEFSVSGGNESRSRFGAVSMDATKNENAVMVTKAQAAQFLALRDAIEEAIAGGPPATLYSAPSTQTFIPPSEGPPTSTTDDSVFIPSEVNDIGGSR